MGEVREWQRSLLCIACWTIFLATTVQLVDNFGEVYFWAAVMTAAVVTSILKCIERYTRTYTPCPLCERRIPDDEISPHRLHCAHHNTKFLRQLDPSSIHCPCCSDPLLLWPTRVGPKHFSCGAKGCPVQSGAKIRNDGGNCFACFICDYYSCLMCIRRTEEENNSVDSSSNNNNTNTCSNINNSNIINSSSNNHNSNTNSSTNNRVSGHNNNSDVNITHNGVMNFEYPEEDLFMPSAPPMEEEQHNGYNMVRWVRSSSAAGGEYCVINVPDRLIMFGQK